jgi:hypothetical protein
MELIQTYNDYSIEIDNLTSNNNLSSSLHDEIIMKFIEKIRSTNLFLLNYFYLREIEEYCFELDSCLHLTLFQIYSRYEMKEDLIVPSEKFFTNQVLILFSLHQQYRKISGSIRCNIFQEKYSSILENIKRSSIHKKLFQILPQESQWLSSESKIKILQSLYYDADLYLIKQPIPLPLFLEINRDIGNYDDNEDYDQEYDEETIEIDNDLDRKFILNSLNFSEIISKLSMNEIFYLYFTFSDIDFMSYNLLYYYINDRLYKYFIENNDKHTLDISNIDSFILKTIPTLEKLMNEYMEFNDLSVKYKVKTNFQKIYHIHKQRDLLNFLNVYNEKYSISIEQFKIHVLEINNKKIEKIQKEEIIKKKEKKDNKEVKQIKRKNNTCHICRNLKSNNILKCSKYFHLL